jgi:hypothetical protein
MATVTVRGQSHQLALFLSHLILDTTFNFLLLNGLLFSRHLLPLPEYFPFFCSPVNFLLFRWPPSFFPVCSPLNDHLTTTCCWAHAPAQSRGPVSLDISPVHYSFSPSWPYFCVDLLLFSLSFPRWTLLYGIVILSFQLAALVLLFMKIHLPVQLAASYPAVQYAVQNSPPFCSDTCPCPAVENSPFYQSVAK